MENFILRSREEPRNENTKYTRNINLLRKWEEIKNTQELEVQNIQELLGSNTRKKIMFGS